MTDDPTMVCPVCQQPSPKSLFHEVRGRHDLLETRTVGGTMAPVCMYCVRAIYLHVVECLTPRAIFP